MTNWVQSLQELHSSMLKSMQSNHKETGTENSSGPEVNPSKESGGDSTQRSWRTKEHSISIKSTSEPNTTTIHMTLTPLQSTETSSNTTTINGSPVKTEDGSSKETDSMSSPPLTSPT